MQTVVVDKVTTVEELIEKAKHSARPLYLGVSGQPEVVVWAIRRELEPEQRTAIKALKGLFSKLQSFEEKHKMDSADFFYRYENRLPGESAEYTSWWIAYSSFAETLQRYNLTRSDVECHLMDGSGSTTGDSVPS
jgi:hypothetical protein